MVFGVATGGEVEGRGQIRIGFVEEQCFKFGVKKLWRDSKGWGRVYFKQNLQLHKTWQSTNYNAETALLHCTFRFYNCTNCDQLGLHVKICPGVGSWSVVDCCRSMAVETHF